MYGNSGVAQKLVACRCCKAAFAPLPAYRLRLTVFICWKCVYA